MLFNLLMGAMDTAIDALEFGPVKAVKINTSYCLLVEKRFPQAGQRDKRGVRQNL